MAHDLRITVSEDGSRHSSRTHTLTCEPTGGDHPEGDAACDLLIGAHARGADLFAPVPANTMCTQQHGGPATASITGRWNGEPVRATFSRANGCEIARWDAMVPVLPSTVPQPS
ncbi:subtilase-type protease inhibitor [Streptomyces sp. ST2-7A]|nr:subtilase-type protease inhibitor [Streptomyces sp. ST2-7A]